MWFEDTVVYDFVGWPSADITENMIVCPNEAPVTIAVSNFSNVDTIFWFDGSSNDSVEVISEGFWTVNLHNECHIREMGTQITFDFCGVEVPNVITPNGDGMNDVLTLAVGEIADFHMIILNRWGNVVYESTDLNDPWNGLNNNVGQECSEGTYFYKVTYQQTNATQVEVVEGFVTLIRNE